MYVQSKQNGHDKVGRLKGSLPGKMLVHYQYQKLSSKGDSQTI